MKGILFWVSILCISLFSGCATNEEQDMKQRAERLLGVSIPNQAEEFQFVEIPASTEFTRPYTAYTSHVRIKIPEEVYLDLLNELGLTLHSTGLQTVDTLFLLTELQQKEGTPSWWKPDPVANELSGAGKLRTAYSESWIVSTYNNGYAYFKSYEAGIPD